MSSATETVVIRRRFNGPPDSGNGGYVCGLLARGLSSAEITLRRPPPLERPLQLVREPDGARRLLDGEDLVASASPCEFDLQVPEPPSLAQAEAAAQDFVGFHQHTFPTCFVCGPRRTDADGLCIFAGPVAGRPLVAAPWQPAASLAAPGGSDVASEYVWAALDCPGAFALQGGERAPVVLGRLQARLIAPLQVGKRYLVLGWPVGAEGRKHYAGTAIFSADGALHAYARAIWIELASAAPSVRGTAGG
jgi:hypothetical protein